ncbi:MAG: pre-peptidase C-terminal domain-containing protein, partial [Tepidisphaeraceae bacterium]
MRRATGAVARYIVDHPNVGRCHSEPLESRTLLAFVGPLPFYTPAAVGMTPRVGVGGVAPTVAPATGSADKSTGYTEEGSGARGGVVASPSPTLSAAAADGSESEPNDTAATATPITVSPTPNIITAAITAGAPTDVDFYSFTLAARSGVFFDVDSREIGLSTTLDSVLTVFNSAGTVNLGGNDDGRDFDGFVLVDDNPTLTSRDSSLYLDLAAGSYVVRVSSFGMTTGSYQLKVTSNSSYTASVPVFSSNPGAADTLYLDFDGHSATDSWNNGNPYVIPAYDLNNNEGEWTPGERKAIENVWRVVADAYSPFALNVTTSYAGGYTPDATAFRHVIGNADGTELGDATLPLGLTLLGSYANFGPGYKTGFTLAKNFGFAVGGAGSSGEIMSKSIELGNTAAHEFGHALGLNHYGGSNPQRTAFMHVNDFGLSRERWAAGLTSDGAGEPAVVLQDDVATISDPVNTFGYRADDHSDTRPAATILSPLGSTYAASGVIRQTADLDYFRFAASGTTSMTLDIPELTGHLDGELRLFDASGNLLASSDTTGRLGTSIVFSLPSAGDYFVEVRSDGIVEGGAAAAPGEIGQYSLLI